MPVIFHEEDKCFHLYNAWISYILRIMDNGQPENLYYGKRLRDREDFSRLHQESLRAQESVNVPEPGQISLNHTALEYPVYGTGDYRGGALTIAQENGSRISCFTYAGHEIISGKPGIAPLPSTYVEEPPEADTLCLRLRDPVTDTALILTYTIFRDYAAITRNARLCHHGVQRLVLEKIMSMSVDFPDSDFELLQLPGAWARERCVERVRPAKGVHAVQSMNGTCSGAEYNPFLALLRPHTTEENGEVYGFSFVYSGNFLAQAEVSAFDMIRVMMGIHPEGFRWELHGGESFQTPEVVMVYSDQGLTGMSRTYHRLYRRRLMRGEWRDRPRPVLLNNWEATYFNFDEEKLLRIAEKAQKAGIELFVLDDGWFGARDSDRRGLGDWQTNRRKIPDGIAGLSRKIEALGLQFGLWIEPEMVNKDSDLYRAHPDWVIGAPGRSESTARHQNVLDFSRSEVVDGIYEMLAKLLREAHISYIKWDMNRYMTEPYSRGTQPSQQGMVMHRYILGMYGLYNRLTTEFPGILFESCASGGARFDPGMLYYAPQTWCSDDTDANERAWIQYGTSLVYPVVSIGSHVSAVPNHQLHRRTPLESRGNVAFFGTFGYEMDLNLLSEEELETVRHQVAFMKKYRRLIQINGDFYRLLSPFEGNDTAWMVVSSDRETALVLFYQSLNRVNARGLRLRLRGLDAGMEYEVSCDVSPAVSERMSRGPGGEDAGRKAASVRSYRAYGDELMQLGVMISRRDLNLKGGDFASLLLIIKKAGAETRLSAAGPASLTDS